MEQIIEGLDNEVTLLLFFSTAIIALVVPLYVARLFYPRTTIQRSEENRGGIINNENEQNLNRPEPNIDSLHDREEGQQNSEPCIEIEADSNLQHDSVSDAQPINGNETAQNPLDDSFVIKVKVQEDTYEQTVTKNTKLLELKQ